jgi:hypothetical protein
MIRSITPIAVICIVLLFSSATQASLKGLILTSPGVYHDYAYQNRAIAQGIAAHVDIRFDVSLAEVGRWKDMDFSGGYDLLVYNICMAANGDGALVANLRRQTEQLGVPALVIHCTMHSFRDTDQWWPFLGLRTRNHEALRALPQQRVGEHPILEGIPADWQLENDELYINLSFDAQPLLTSAGEDGRPHVTTWLRERGKARVFGTTLGHTQQTMDDPVYQRLLANAVLWATGQPVQTSAPTERTDGVIANFAAPAGVDYLDAGGRDCAMSKLRKAVGPCYLGCVLNPLLWGEAAGQCKEECIVHSPSTDELAAMCTAR